MARIAGVDLPRDKRVEIGLTYIYGIGLSSSQEILAKTGKSQNQRFQRTGALCLPRRIAGSEKQTVRHVFNGDGYRHLPDAAQRLLYGLQKR